MKTKLAIEGNVLYSKRALKPGDIANARVVSIYKAEKEVDKINGAKSASIWLTGRLNQIITKDLYKRQSHPIR